GAGWFPRCELDSTPAAGRSTRTAGNRGDRRRTSATSPLGWSRNHEGLPRVAPAGPGSGIVRGCGVPMPCSELLGQTQAGELPAHGGVEEVAIGGAHVVFRRGATAATQHHLPGHELAVVLTQAAAQRPKAGVGPIGAGRPFPDIAVELLQAIAGSCSHRLQLAALDKIAPQWLVLRGDFPFFFAWQTRLRPSGKGLGLEITQVANRCMQIQLAWAAQGQLQPVVTLPVQRRLPAGALDMVPTVRQPQGGAAITAIANELQVLAIAHRPAGQLKGLDEHPMARPLAVEGKAFAAMANLAQPGGELNPAQLARACSARLQVMPVNRPQRVL